MLYMAIFVRRAPKSLYFSYMILSLVLFNAGYLFELSGGGYEPALLAAKIEYLGVPYITPFLFLFVCEYCAKITVRLKHIILVMAVPVFTTFLVVTWPLSRLFYKELIYDPDAVIPRFIVTGGVAYYIYFAYTYVVVLCALYIVVVYRKKGDALFKKQTTSLALGALLPVLGFTVNISGLGNLPIDMTPIMLSGACILLGHSIFRQGLYVLAPIAQEQVVENMNDGFVLIDVQGLFIDANSAAKKLFPALSTLQPCSGMPNLTEITWLQEDDNSKKEFTITDNTGTIKYYQASRNYIENNGKIIGRSIMIYDITEAKERLNEVREIAEHDSLTGLINRGTLYTNGKAIFSQFTAKTCAAVLMMDIDFFKKINDTFGHLNGDEVLKSVAHSLLTRLRATDLVGRYGGEEFCVFLPRVRLDHLVNLAEKLRKGVENLDITLNGEQVFVTISIGVAAYDDIRHTSFETFLADADTALYAAKNSGRNCVKCFELSRK